MTPPAGSCLTCGTGVGAGAAARISGARGAWCGAKLWRASGGALAAGGGPGGRASAIWAGAGARGAVNSRLRAKRITSMRAAASAGIPAHDNQRCRTGWGWGMRAWSPGGSERATTWRQSGHIARCASVCCRWSAGRVCSTNALSWSASGCCPVWRSSLIVAWLLQRRSLPSALRTRWFANFAANHAD
jgi:hypothetical protein